jgi:hypothetical protein
MTGKDWWELITRSLTVVLAGVALLVALYGYNVFHREVERMQGDVKKLQDQVTSLGNQVTEARIKALDELNTVAREAEVRVTKLQLQTEHSRKGAEEDAQKVAESLKKTKGVLDTADELVKAASNLDEPTKILFLKALKNEKLPELASVLAQVKTLNADFLATKKKAETTEATLGKITGGWVVIESKQGDGFVLDAHRQAAAGNKTLILEQPIKLQAGWSKNQLNRLWRLVPDK